MFCRLAVSFFALLGALALNAVRGNARETIVRVTDVQSATRGYSETLQWPVLVQGVADTTISRLWGLAVDTPIDEALIGLEAAQIRLVKVSAGDIPLPAARIAVADIANLRERMRSKIVADIQIARYAPHGVSRAMVVEESGARLELFEPGARPMTEQELRIFAARGRYSTWTRFNNKLTGSVVWRPDGTAHVKWNQGTLDEEGTWTIRGDAVCTAWFRLRNGQELCVQHYRLFCDTTQSFRADGTPDGIHTWKPAGELN